MRTNSPGRHPFKNRNWSGTRLFSITGFAAAAALISQEGIAQGDALAVLFGCLFVVTLSSCTWIAHQAKRPH